MAFPIIIRTKHFPAKPYYGISLCGFVFFRKDIRVTDADIRHETIHFRQQMEWLFVFFFLMYVLEFLWLLLRYREWHKAYRNISFEREAYTHQHEAEYLKRRKLWANYRR